MSRHDFSNLKTLAVLSCSVLCVLTGSIRAGRAGAPKTTRSQVVVTVDALGDAQISHELRLPIVRYASMKSTLNHPQQVLHAIAADSLWLETDHSAARFDDGRQAVRSESAYRGLARTIAADRWCIEIAPADNLQLIDISNNSAVFCRVEPSPAGVVSHYVRLELPEGSTDVSYDGHRQRLTYRHRPQLEEGTSVETDYRIDARQHLVSSLAKIYGDQDTRLWAARSAFTNTGNQTLRGFRIRFRVANYSSWSGWKRCEIVYPGQTVRDYFHPVFDIEKLASLTGTRHAMVETEFQYTTGEGERIEDSDSCRVQMLSRNEVVYSTRPDADNLTWFDQFDLAPRILTCFTNGTDPVMQQFAGRISAVAGGPASSLNSEHAVQFLMTMWGVLQHNGIAYQTPPSYTVNEHFGQHVKYGRDVLRNRAGTCIDLAILWASVAEAVGLESHICLVPGHAFPAVRLPNGNLIPFEATVIGEENFKEAVDLGFATLKKWREDGRLIVVDIQELKSSGARSLDLPRLSEDVLSKWGYEFKTTRAASQLTARLSQQLLCGATWAVDYTVDGVRIVGSQTFQPNGRYISALMFIYEDGEMEESSEYGTYVDHGGHFEFETNLGHYDQKYRVSGERMELLFEDMEAWIPYARKAN